MKKNLPLPFALIVFLFAFLPTSLLHANNFQVTNGNNSGPGSLRQAILDANADPSAPHTITFTVSGVINITSSLPTITRQVTIDGGNNVTISGPGGNNSIALFVLGTGSGGSIIRNMTMRNTGIEPIRLAVALIAVTIENMIINQTGPHYLNHAILANAAVTNMTIRNVTLVGLEDRQIGLYFAGNVTNMVIDGYNISGGAGLTARAMHVQGAVNGLTIKNSMIDLDDPATTDDGDYGVVFASAVNNLTIDSTTFRDNEISAVHFGAGATNINIKNSQFDNLDGWTGTTFVNFRGNTNTVTIDKNVFDANYNPGTNDGNYGILFYSATNQTLNITNNQFNENDTSGVYIGRINTASNHDNVLIKGNTFTRNGNGSLGAIDFIVRNTSSDGGPILITENTFSDNNGAAIFPHPGNTTSYVVPNFTISKNIIYNTKSTLGTIRVNYLDKIIITQNSIYNNQGLGIQLADGTAANCGYEGANTPTIVSSTETTPGVYNVVVKMPTICGTGNCSLELFSNEAGIKGVGGQHYVVTKTGLSSGNNTLTGITGSFPEITAAPYGTWSATLRVSNNCGTSEFSNKKSIKPNGPAGISNGIAVWLRGDDISVNNAEPTASGQVITGWEEFSGVGPSATTIISNPLTKLSGINFNPVANMSNDGIRGHFSGAPTWLNTSTTTTVGVFNPLSTTASNDRFFCLFSQAGSDYNTNFAQIEFWRNGNNIQAYRGNTALNPVIPGTTGVSAFNKPGVFSSVTSASSHTYHYNGANMGSGNYNKGSFAISQWFVGTGWNTTDSWQGGSETEFAEVFTYNRVLSAGELQKVQSYMALKYGIAMKQNYILSDSTVIWNVTTNAAHSKEIAALARDNVSVLYQKQARAYHADEVVTIASGNEIAATNNDNADSIINNLSVFMWGNDSASTALTTTFTAGTYSSTRMARVWKVQKTNWADKNITIQLKNGKTNNYLLISTSPTFATITQELQLSTTGTITLSSSLLPDGAYFTFGRQQKAPGGVANGLDVWTKADEGVTLTGTNAITWEDQSPSQRIWTKVNANTLTWNSSAMNYNPAIQFPGPGAPANYFTYSPQFTPSYTQGEVFSAQSSAVNNVEGFPWQLGGNSGTIVLWYRYTDNNMYLHFGTNARRNFSFGTKNMALPVILNVNTLSNSWTASLDGKQMLTAAYPTVFAQTGTNNALGVAYGSYFNGPVSEIILYKRKLNVTERLQVNSYMAIRYGITLDQTTPTDYLASDGITTMWKASDNTGYANNIAGIGRDEIGSLYQKQSRSINTASSGNLIAIAVGNEIAASNADKTDTITNNKSFLIWGDNNGAVTYATAVTATNVTLRMARVWKVDKTNWADGNVTIKLHGSATNTYLLISNSDATFATISQELPVNPDSTITINSSLLPDGAYFTFGKELIGPGFVNSGVQVWLRADDGVSSNDTWFDYSGNDANATQATVANQPVLTTAASNFNPAYRFNGTTHYMDVPYNAAFNGNVTVYTVHSQPAASGFRTPISSRNSSGGLSKGWNYYRNVSTREFWTGTNTASWSTLTGGTTALNTEIIGLDATLGSGNAIKHIYSNGLTTGTVTNGTYITNATAPLRIGAISDGPTLWWNGDIVESVVYNRVLSATERNHVESYLALKYGVTLNQATPTDYVATDWDGVTGTKMWAASKNGVYNNNIAGIGRDDKTALYQKQSRSSSDSTIIIATGAGVAADNVSNTASIDDLSFFAWADDGSPTTFSVAVSGVPNATSRMARVWKIDRTNWTDQDVTFKVLQGGERYLLVHATDPAFGAGTVEYAVTTLTGTVTINTSNLPDGAYFTLGTKIVGPGCVNNGIVAWFRSDYAASASSWSDFSGNQTHASQATVANQPAVSVGVLNYNPALVFNGTTDNLSIPNSSMTGKFSFGNAARTVIATGVPNTAAPATYGMLFTYGANGAGTGCYLGQAGAVNTAASFGAYNSATYNIVGSVGTFPLNKTSIIGGRYSGTTAYLDINGQQNSSLVTAWNTNSAQNAFIGQGAPSTSNFWNGKTGEIIVYNRELTPAELLRVNSYLALKYGITLNQTVATDYVASDGTTTMWKAPDNVGFNKRITGIGRDDCTELYQKQSLSVDTGIVALAIGDAIDTTNLANTNTIDNNNSYFVFADDGGSTAYNTALTGLDPITARMARMWKVDKTNWSDAEVTFKLTGGNDKIYMVVSADATFDGSDAAYQLDIDGNVTIATDLIPDGAYFTFAKILRGPAFVNLGIRIWLDANDGLTDITNGVEWQDKSGNDLHVLQTTDIQEAVLGATDSSGNYNATVDFDGNDVFETDQQVLRSATSDGTVFFVAKYRDFTGYDSPVDFDADDPHLGRLSSSVGAYKNGSTPVEFFPGGNQTLTLNKTHISGYIWGGGTNGGIELRKDAASAVNTTMDFNNIAYTQNFGVGGYITGAEGINGTMSEVIVYDRKLTASQTNMVESYLALKYGITLDQTTATHYTASDGTTRMWDASTGDNATYKNNIAGIGRDDNGSLYQKQSRSINTANNGNMVAIGLGAIAATNKDNTSTIADDMSFLVWGDNGVTGTKTTEYPVALLNPGGCSKVTRLQREWKVQVTGTVSDLQMKMYLSGLVPVSTGQSDLKLLIDDDGDFGNGGTSVVDPAAYDDVTQIVTFNSLSFISGQYFTLVTDLTNEAPGGVLTNLYTWYRADKGVSTATGVSLWTDQSSSLEDVAQGTTGAQPTYNKTSNLINFNPNLSFDGNDVMSNTAVSHSAAANGEEIFAVVLPNTVAAAHNIVGLGTTANTNNSTELRLNSANQLQYGAGAAFTSITNATASNGLVQIANAGRSSTGVGANLLLNGTSVATGTIAPMFTLDYLNIGGRRLAAVNNQLFNGKIAEVMIYNRQLTSIERQKITSYLAIKYGITLPHDYITPAGMVIWNVTTNSGYNNNITGIARDNCNGLHQKQSKSVNSAEALVTLGNYTGISTTNALNPNTLDNETSLLFGDNNGNRTAWTATGAPLNRERLARTWKIQESGNVSTVTIQVPANSSGATVKLPLERDGIVYLLISASGDFVNDVTEVPMTLNGTDWETTYDFADGQYFTFATNNTCVSATPLLAGYGTLTNAATDKCYVNGWILFRDPVDAGKYIAAVYDPAGLIDLTKITASLHVNSAYADIGKGNSIQAVRLMRRMLQLDCANCYDAGANPSPDFIVRMFYSPTEKSDAESVEPNNMESIKTANGLTDPSIFKWFKAAGMTAAQVISGLSPSGMAAGGQEWFDGTLPIGQIGNVDYIDFTGINSFSTFGGIWAVNSMHVLPVRWISVQAVPVNEHTISVKWSAISDINNTGFIVERSEDGQHYRPITSLIPPGANPGVAASYSVNDNNVNAGVPYYYRIRQTDQNGHINYSKVVIAKLKDGDIKYVQIKPNPVSKTLRWEVYVSHKQQLNVSIVDATGKTIRHKQLQAQAGSNAYTMDVSGLSSAIYLLRVTGEDGSSGIEKFILR